MLSEPPRARETFERHPALASWIERLGNTDMSLPLGEWCVFIGALNQALDAARSEADERVKGLVAPITMQDVRLAVGEGPLSPLDVLNGCNAELRRRSALKSMEDSHPVSGSVPSPVGEGESPPAETWLERWKRLGAERDWAGRVAMLRAPAPPPSSQPSKILPGEGE